MIKLYNTKTNKIEEFKPIRENEVSMYVCGPTVYNHAHIGNARPLIVFDTLRRLFEAQGYTVNYASNFTDVDDKIIKTAKEEGVTEKDITTRYIDAYQKLRGSLNTLPLYAQPKVTETMEDIIHFIDELVKLDHAYAVDGDVYFSVDSVKSYGEISHQKLEDLMVGARIEENSKKRNPLDFTLWKATDEGIQWDSPWSKGRPGWHTECVVMIDNVFGGQIDIHGGGMDLRFPHHENEVAQSQACHHHAIANYWMHNAMINIDGQKMSKSLGNVRWAKDVIEMLGADVVRWLMLSVHYRGELNFSDETIETAKTELNKVKMALKQAELKIALQNADAVEVLDEGYAKFIDAMNQDMNTPNAYAVIFEEVKKLNTLCRTREVNVEALGSAVYSLRKMLEVLGVMIPVLTLSEEDRALYQAWMDAKAQKDFAKADEVRAQLMERGIL